MQHDLKPWFDQKISCITTICNQKCNISLQICKFIDQTKENIKHHPVTHFGVSKHYQSTKTENPILDTAKAQERKARKKLYNRNYHKNH